MTGYSEDDVNQTYYLFTTTDKDRLQDISRVPTRLFEALVVLRDALDAMASGYTPATQANLDALADAMQNLLFPGMNEEVQA